jgi:hypothetical protein
MPDGSENNRAVSGHNSKKVLTEEEIQAGGVAVQRLRTLRCFQVYVIAADDFASYPSDPFIYIHSTFANF